MKKKSALAIVAVAGILAVVGLRRSSGSTTPPPPGLTFSFGTSTTPVIQSGFSTEADAIAAGQAYANANSEDVLVDDSNGDLVATLTPQAPVVLSSFVVTAADALDVSDPHNWEVWFDIPPSEILPYIGGGVYTTPSQFATVLPSGDTWTVSPGPTLAVGPHYIVFAVKQNNGAAYGTYSGTVTLGDAAPQPFSGVDYQDFAQIQFTLNADGSVTA